MGELLAARLESVVLPGENYVGEPFWCITELKEGKVTGTYLGEKDNPSIPGGAALPLFFSKKHAHAYLSSGDSPDEYAVRGLPQHSSRGTILVAAHMREPFAVIHYFFEDTGTFPATMRWPEELADLYYLPASPTVILLNISRDVLYLIEISQKNDAI